MDRRNQISIGEAKAIAQEEREKAERRESKGLCQYCGDNPQNPYLGDSVCLDCWNSEEFMGCMVKGCPSNSAGTYHQGRFCEAHLADVIHSEYEKYMAQKAELEERLQQFEDRVDELQFDPRNQSKDPAIMTEAESKLLDEWTHIQLEKRNMSWLKSDIKSSMEQLDKPFHENYTVFG